MNAGRRARSGRPDRASGRGAGGSRGAGDRGAEGHGGAGGDRRTGGGRRAGDGQGSAAREWRPRGQRTDRDQPREGRPRGEPRAGGGRYAAGGGRPYERDGGNGRGRFGGDDRGGGDRGGDAGRGSFAGGRRGGYGDRRVGSGSTRGDRRDGTRTEPPREGRRDDRSDRGRYRAPDTGVGDRAARRTPPQEELRRAEVGRQRTAYEREARPRQGPRDDRAGRFGRTVERREPARDRGPRRDGAAEKVSGYDRGRYADRDTVSRGRGDRATYGERGDRPGYGGRGDRATYGERGDRPGYGERGDRPGYGERGDRPGYGERGDRPGYGERGDRPGYGGRGDRDSGYRGPGKGEARDRGVPGRVPGDGRPGRGDRATRPRREEPPRAPGGAAERAPELAEDIDPRDLDPAVRAELNSLNRPVAETVARHLVATGRLLDEDPQRALAHALAARRLAARVAAVREAAGLAAYHAGQWSTVIAELRAYHRMAGSVAHLAVLADAERALGRPERAVDLYRTADRTRLDPAAAIELLIVAAGARRDLGQDAAAAAMLQVRELAADTDEPWLARLRYAYADALLQLGRREEAREWFARAAEVDEDAGTDAAERLLELDGVVLEDGEGLGVGKDTEDSEG